MVGDGSHSSQQCNHRQLSAYSPAGAQLAFRYLYSNICTVLLGPRDPKKNEQVARCDAHSPKMGDKILAIAMNGLIECYPTRHGHANGTSFLPPTTPGCSRKLCPAPLLLQTSHSQRVANSAYPLASSSYVERSLGRNHLQILCVSIQFDEQDNQFVPSVDGTTLE